MEKGTNVFKKTLGTKIKFFLSIFLLKLTALFIIISILMMHFASLLNFFVILFSILKVPSTATEISFYDSDSYFGLPLEINTKDENSVLKKGFIGKQEELQKLIKSLEQELQTLLNIKYGTGKYVINIKTDNKYYDKKNNILYKNIVDITTGKENISTFGVVIKNVEKDIIEGIYYNSRIDQEGFFEKVINKVLFKFGYIEKIGYVGENNTNTIMFLKQDSLNANRQFNIFYKNLQKGLGNDGKIKENTQEAFKYLFDDLNNEDNKILNFETYNFIPYIYGEIKDNKIVVLSDFCSVKYSTKNISDLDCSDGNVTIKITDDKYHEILDNEILNKGFKLKNVKIKKSELIKAKLRKITELIHKNNSIKLNKSYFIDMANYIGTDASNSNQKVLSQQKIDLSYFSDKQIGKDYKNLILLSKDVKNFSQENAKKVLQYKDDDDTLFYYFYGERNDIPIYKNKNGYSTQRVKYKCKRGEDVVYPNFDSLVYGFEVQDDELFLGKKIICKQIWMAPPLLKKAEIKYYKTFIFKGEKNGNIIGKLHNKDDFRLNYFYHYNRPSIVDSVSLAGEDNIISNVDYVTRVGLDKKSIIWKGIYLKISSFGGELKDGNEGGFSIKRDVKTGLILLENAPVRFELGLLTKLDDEEFKNIKNEKGEIEKIKVKNKTVVDFEKNNIGKTDEENNFLKLLKDKSIFDDIPLKDFLNDKTLSFDIPRIYGEKIIQQYKNNFIDDLQKQKKLIRILDDTFFSTDINGKKIFTVDGVLKKYLALYSEYTYGNNNRIQMDLCTKYKKISYIANLSKNKTSEIINDKGLISIRKNQLNSLSQLYNNCFFNYFSQGKINIVDVGFFYEKNEGISYLNNIKPYIIGSFNTDKNEIYFLYKELLTNPIYDGILEKGRHITINPKTNRYYTGNEVDIDFYGYKNFFIDYFLGNNGSNNNDVVRIELLNLLKKISLKNPNIIYNEDIISELKSKISNTDKYFLEQEYFDLLIVDELFVEEKNVNKYYGDRKIRDKSYFFNINKAFSFESDIYNKEQNLHELYLNPNIYLYSFFHYTKKYNTAYNININNENKLMHYPSTVNKREIDSNYLYSYSDFISLNILNEIILGQYRNIYTSLRDYCYKNTTWFLFNCSDDIKGDFDLIKPEEDLKTLTYFSKLLNNNINKDGFINKQFNNIALYNSISNKKIEYIPAMLNIPLDYFYNEIKFNKNDNKSIKIGNFLLSVKITNLINFYKTINKELLKNSNKYKKEIAMNEQKISFLRYLFALTNKISSDGNEVLKGSNVEIFIYALLNYKKRENENKNENEEEYKMITKEIFDYLFTIKYKNEYERFFKKFYSNIELSKIENDNYKYDLSNYILGLDDDDKEKQTFLVKYFGRLENATIKYSNIKNNITVIDYSKLKKIINPLLQTGSISDSHILNIGTGSNYRISDAINKYFDLTDVEYKKNYVLDISNIDNTIKTVKDIQLEDINNLNYFLFDVYKYVNLSEGISIDGFISTLKKVNQCKNFLLENNEILHDALFTTDYGYNNFQIKDKIKLFENLTSNNLLRCGINKDEYINYINYINRSYALYSHNTLFFKEFFLSLNQNYLLYKGVNYYDFNNKMILGGGKNFFNGSNIEKTSLYELISKSFNNLEERKIKKVKYKFIETTEENGLPITFKGIDNNYNLEKILGIYYNLFLAMIVSNNIALYQGLNDLSIELFNYSLNNDKNKIAYISEFKNLGPFYYLYTNNGYIDPKSGIYFSLVKNISDNIDINGANFNLFQGMGNKFFINEQLDNISKGYCEQQIGDKKLKCKSYMEFLKGMSLTRYRQELEFLDMLIASKKIVGKRPTYSPQTTGPFIIDNNRVVNNIKYIDPELGNRMIETYKNRKANVYVGQCTWFLHLVKDWDLGGSGRDYYDKARNAGYSTDNYTGLPVEEKLKIIQVGDIISFFGWNESGGKYCNKIGDAGKYGHVALVVGKNLDNKTIKVAQMNFASLFITDTKDLLVETMCDGGVIHNIRDRYSENNVIFLQGPIIDN